MQFYITKASGKKELFDIKKIERSLRKAGASDELIEQIVTDIKKAPDIKTTQAIYKYVLAYLKKKSPPLASRYNLKLALVELGPAGYPFEKFVAEIFRAQQYKVEINKTIKGMCIAHETDFIATKDKKNIMAECKFHGRQGIKTDVKVTLYVHARFDDIEKVHEERKDRYEEIHKALVVTNTRFTSQAIKYGQCVGINLIDWSYPKGNSLPDLIHKFKVHPITTLASLTKHQKREFVKNGFVLCMHAEKNIPLLKKMGFTDHKIKKLLEEIKAMCEIE